MREISRIFIVSAISVGLGACSPADESPAEGESPTDPPPAAQQGPSKGDTGGPGGSGTGVTPQPGPPRPAPQSRIRECGTRKTQPEPLRKYTQWTHFAPVKPGQRVLGDTFKTASFGGLWAQGTATRLSAGVTSMSMTSADADKASFRSVVGLKAPEQLGANTYFTGRIPHDREAEVFYIEPSSRILTFVSAWGQTEDGWSITEPRRTSETGSVGTDLFARALVPGRFFAYEILLLFADDCSVGALSDALGRPALVRDARPDSGIFAPEKIAASQEVLVANGVRMMVRVLSNKASNTIDALLESTSCSTGDLAACKELLAKIASESQKLGSQSPSSLAKLESGTDPSWDTIEVVAAPISILEP